MYITGEAFRAMVTEIVSDVLASSLEATFDNVGVYAPL